MIFALDYLNRMERAYPGVLAMMQRSKDPESIMAGKGVSPDVAAGMLALMHWRQDKVIYNFEDSIAREIMEQTDDPDRSFPISCMRQLPYPCIAAHTTPIAIMDPGSQKVLEEYTGNAFLWLEGDVLHTCWQFQGDQYLHASMMLKDGIDDCFESIVVENLKRHFSAAEITEIKQIFGVERLSDLTSLSSEAYLELEKRFGSRVQGISHSIQLANVQEVLMQRALHIILYLACDNADIEAAEEKLKAGAWATSIGGEPRAVKRNERRQALRETEGVNVQDVGYRIAGKYKRSYSEEREKSDSTGTGATRGYGKRRAHFHHFWIGPRDGAIATDIMDPKPGERGLRLRWIEATEIHPELRDGNATIVNVERL